MSTGASPGRPAWVATGGRQPLTSRHVCVGLWSAFLDGRSRAARNDLILAYEPLVKGTVSRLPANVLAHWEADDLRSFGLLGLVDAIDRWDGDSPADRFPAYAAKRIRGAVYDELRHLDWLPRTVRRRVIAYRATEEALTAELSRQPETAEVLTELGIGRDGADAVLTEVRSSQLLHLQHRVGGASGEDDTQLIDLIVSDEATEPEPQLLHSEQLEQVRQAVTQLPERQRTVVTLHFLAGLTQEQIGAMLGVSNSRVCQIEASAIQVLRRVLAGDGGRSPARTA